MTLSPPDEVSSGSLTIRPFGPDDVPALHAAVLDNLEHLRPFMLWAAHEPALIEERYALVERWSEANASGKEWQCGLFLEGRLVGAAGLMAGGEAGVFEIGYWVHTAFARRGVATLAAFLLTEVAFSSPETDAVEIRHDQANEVSGRVPARLGYVLVRSRPTDPEATPHGGSGFDRIWRATRSEWQATSHAIPCLREATAPVAEGDNPEAR